MFDETKNKAVKNVLDWVYHTCYLTEKHKFKNYLKGMFVKLELII